jgi:hypothetical protein
MAISHDEGQDQALRVHLLQHACAADASVIIQVAGNLYLSDASLSALWTPGGTVPSDCPFPGLDAFGPGQARWFFGRDKLTAELVDQLDGALLARSGGPVLVVGPSGSGKSSLLGAGLFAALGEGRLPVAGSDAWPRLLFTPGAHPLQTLQEARTSCERAQGGAAVRVVILIDQLEEIFTACSDETERSEFLGAIEDLASADGPAGSGPAALVVLVLRADFYARATAYPVLREAMRSRQAVLGAMSPAEVRQAIAGPAGAAGLTLDAGLVERMLRDLGLDETGEYGPGGYEPGRLPLLAHALRATWLRRDGSRLTLSGYEAAGGIHGAIARTAENVYAKLDDAGQRAARQVFLALVRIGEAAGDADEGTVDTRRRVSAESLYARVSDPGAAGEVLAAFTSARLLTSGGQSVEITHEALLRRWPRLRDWITEDRSGNLVRQNLEEAAGTWDREGRDPAGLYGGIRLGAARAWAGGRSRDLSAVARDFLAASDRRRRRAARRRSGLIALLTALSLALAGLTGYAFRQRAAAEASFQRAESQVLVTQSAQALSNHDPGTALEFAEQAERLNPSSRRQSAHC